MMLLNVLIETLSKVEYLFGFVSILISILVVHIFRTFSGLVLYRKEIKFDLTLSLWLLLILINFHLRGYRYHVAYDLTNNIKNPFEP